MNEGFLENIMYLARICYNIMVLIKIRACKMSITLIFMWRTYCLNFRLAKTFFVHCLDVETIFNSYKDAALSFCLITVLTFKLPDEMNKLRHN